MTLESYGYKFLRINRFNLGHDPVETLSERLSSLIHAATNDEDVALVSDIRSRASELEEGTSKHCRKCDEVKSKQDFWDPKLGGGKGGFGQICMTCKVKPASSGSRRSFRHRSYRKYY